MSKDVTVKTWSMNETRHFRQWLSSIKNKKIRILRVLSKGNYLTMIEYEVLEDV